MSKRNPGLAPAPLKRGATINLRLLARGLLAWFRRQARDLPWRRTHDPYAVWVSEVMLQQTQVKTVVPYYQRWMRAFPSVQPLARAAPGKVLRLWAGLGYYSRAQNLQRAARIMVAKHHGQVPRSFDELLALPGIGRYTAGAIASIAFNQPRPVLDGNVVRVLTRLFGIRRSPAETNTRERLWRLAATMVRIASLLPARRRRLCADFNQAIMELGAVVCTPWHPNCPRCPVAPCCQARQRGIVDQIPAQPRRLPSKTVDRVGFVIRWRGRFLVRRRPADGVNPNLWEFPNAEWDSNDEVPMSDVARGVLRLQITGLEPWLVLRHSIMRQRIRLQVWRGEWPGLEAPSPSHGRWLTPTALRQLPLTAADSQIAQRLQHGY